MIRLNPKIRLLGSAALGVGLAVLASAPAQATCTVAAGVVTCATTTTTNTTNAGGTPAPDRNYPVNTSAAAFTGTVSTGAVVDGFGLAFTNTVGGTNALNVVNNGTVQINAINNATAGGGAALQVTAIGATPVNYSGEGNVINLSTAVGTGLEFLMTGSGDLIANVGVDGGATTTISAANSSAIVVDQFSGSAGNVTVNTTSDTTLRGLFAGIQIAANGPGAVTVNNAATIGSLITRPNDLSAGVNVNHFGSGAISITNSGNIGSATDRVSGGLVANGTVASSTAEISVVNTTGNIFSRSVGLSIQNLTIGNSVITNGSGFIDSTNFGIFLNGQSSGTSTVTTGTGSITAANMDAINVSNFRESIFVTTGIGALTGGRNGIFAAHYGGGTMSISVNGVVTGTAASGIESFTFGSRTITVGTGGNVTGGTQAILFTEGGRGTITNGGIIGAAATGLAINAASATGPVIVTNSAGGTINGRLMLGAGADTVTNNGIFNTQGVTNFAGGADALINTGTINTTAATTFLNLETLTNSGTLNANFGLTFDGSRTAFANSGTLNSAGTIVFVNDASTFTNSGAGIFNLTANTTVTGLETITQSGRINLNTFTLAGPGAFFVNSGFVDTNGSAGLAGFESLSNIGTIDLAPGTFTVPAVVFTNSGTILADEGASTITGQTSFANSGTLDLQDGVVGDVLTINSSFAGSGGSNLLIDASGTLGDRLIINGAASGSTAVNVNLLSPGFFNQTGVLVVDNAASTTNAFVLGSTNNINPLLNFALEQRGADFFLTAAPTAAAFEPLSLASAATDMWYQSADEVIAQTRLPTQPEGWSIWGQIYASRDKFNGNNGDVTINGIDYDTNSGSRNHRYGVQSGVDFGFGGGRIGVTGGYARNKVSSAADLKIKGWNIGVYGQFGGLTGFHGEGLFKYDRYTVDVNDGAFAGNRSRLRSTGLDGALGYRFGFGGDTSIDLNAGVAHVWSKLGGIDNFGFSYDYSKITSTRGRAGVRAVFGSTGWRPYVDATVLHEFDGKASVNLFDGANNYDLDNSGKGTWARFEAGVGGPSSGAGPILAAWADVGDKKGVGVRLGFRFGAGHEEMAPPPPPPMAPMAPPPPPPSATQTCSDGSVILASDSCPPPPPPPAEPERG